MSMDAPGGGNARWSGEGEPWLRPHLGVLAQMGLSRMPGSRAFERYPSGFGEDGQDRIERVVFNEDGTLHCSATHLRGDQGLPYYSAESGPLETLARADRWLEVDRLSAPGRQHVGAMGRPAEPAASECSLVVDVAAEAGQPDWEKLKASIYSWDAFERGDDEMSVRDFVEGLMTNFEALREGGLEQCCENGWVGAETLLKQAGYDADAVREAFPERFDKLRYAVEAAMRFNIEALAPRQLLIRMDDEVTLGDLFVDPEVVGRQMSALTLVAERFGYDELAVREVVSNATYGGMAGVGVLVSGAEVVGAWRAGQQQEGSEKLPSKLKGPTILYCTNRTNGSGYLVSGGVGQVEVADLAGSIDFGAYSLGAVFGTDEWRY